jgi:predicted MFS family arabinose efflux permease
MASPAHEPLTQPPWVPTVLLVMAACGVTQGFARFTMALTLPDMTEDLLGSYSAAGWAGTANLGAYLLSVIAVSRLGSRIEPTVLVKVGLVATTVGMTIVAAAPNYLVLLAGMCLAGSGGAGVWVPSTVVVNTVVPVARRGFALGLSTAGIGVSIVLTGRIVALVDARWGAQAWRPVWLIEVGIAVAVLVPVLVWLRPVHSVGPRLRPSERALRLLPGGWGLLASYGLYGVAFALYTSFLVAALEDDAGFTASHAALAYSLLGICSAAGGMIVGRLSDRAGRRSTLVGANLVTAGCCLAIPIGSEPFASMSALLFGLLMTGSGTVVVAYIGDHLDGADIAAAFGMITLALGLAQVVSPPIGGWIADRTDGFTVTYVIASAMAVLAAMAATRLQTGRAGRHRPRAGDRDMVKAR